MNFKDVCCERCGKSRRCLSKIGDMFLANPQLMYTALAIFFLPPDYQQFAYEQTFKAFECCFTGAFLL